MEKTTITDVVNDLKAKRDCLALAHENLKRNNDDWNKSIIVLSLLTGMLESAKIQMSWTSDIFALMPILLSSIIASISALIKFRDFPAQMETLIQAQSMLTSTLCKCRNHTELNDDMKQEYNDALEKLEVSVYPDIRKQFLRVSHRNLIDIMKQEQRYFKNIELVNSGQEVISSESSSSSSSLSSASVERPVDSVDVEDLIV